MPAEYLTSPEHFCVAAPDYIVVGAGSAGCVLARRLVDAGRSVTLVEAGPPDYLADYRIHMPAALSHVLSGTTYNWDYRTLPEPHMAGRRMFCPRGKTLGGSSAINGMIYVRGHQEDFNQWAALSGYDDWRAEHCLPYFKRAEAVEFEAEVLRGRDGPLRISRGAMANPLFTAFIEAGQQAGHDCSEDLNGEGQEGVGAFDRTISGGRRLSAARGYLRLIRKSKLLTILTRARATRLINEGTRVTGVEIIQGGKRRVISGGEILVCAGAIDSPRLLMRSGIGDAAIITGAGLPVIHELPGVGQNLQDHLEVYVQQACTAPVSIYPALKWYNQAWIGALWYLAHKGPGATNHFEAGGFLRSSEAAPWPDLQLHFLPVAMNYDGSTSADQHGFQIHVGPMKPLSRGRVTLSGIQFNYAQAQVDREVMRSGIRKVREIISQPAFDGFRGAELTPGSHVQSDADLDAFVAQRGESAYHPCGTCRMGQDAMSVVDNAGRVHGLSCLRVVDASIMPVITNGNLNAPVIMLAEKIAAAMLA